jgi:pantothenate kinase
VFWESSTTSTGRRLPVPGTYLPGTLLSLSYLVVRVNTNEILHQQKYVPRWVDHRHCRLYTSGVYYDNDSSNEHGTILARVPAEWELFVNKENNSRKKK